DVLEWRPSMALPGRNPGALGKVSAKSESCPLFWGCGLGVKEKATKKHEKRAKRAEPKRLLHLALWHQSTEGGRQLLDLVLRVVPPGGNSNERAPGKCLPLPFVDVPADKFLGPFDDRRLGAIPLPQAPPQCHGIRRVWQSERGHRPVQRRLDGRRQAQARPLAQALPHAAG